MTQRFAGFRLVFAVVALALWAGDAANAQVERTPTAENVVRNVKRTPSLDANPGVAPRRVSEEPVAPVAASRTPADGGARAARVGGTGGDARTGTVTPSARGGNRDKEPCETTATISANDLACCLRTCRKRLFMCVVGNPNTCATDDVAESTDTFKTPIQCLNEHKCCLETECPFPDDCRPNDCETCSPNLGDACQAGADCCESQCICSICGNGDVPDCCEDIDCGSGEICCAGVCTADVCCRDDPYGDYCSGNDDSQPGFCCLGECFEFGKSCGGDTCYSKGTQSCCWKDDNCGFPVVSLGQTANWGWTNGPYDITSGPISLDVICGGGGGTGCEPNDPFESGLMTVIATGDIITMTWSGDAPTTTPIGGWQVHLGCGNEPYATKPPNGVPTISPGQYEFTGNDPTLIEITDVIYAKCKDLWIIIHFNNDKVR